MTKLSEFNRVHEETANTNLGRRRVVLESDNLPKMILKFEDVIPCLACESGRSESKSRDFESFLRKLKESDVLSASEEAMDVTSRKLGFQMAEVTKCMSKTVNCISCRAAVERLVKQIVPTCESAADYSFALDPVRVDRSGRVSIKPSLLKPESLYNLVYIDSSKLEDGFNQLVNGKKQMNKRCALHSSDTQKQARIKWINEWGNFWDTIESDECRRKILIVDSVELLDSLNKYLKKNKFCSDCKLKILIAFKSLTKEAVLEMNDSTYKSEMFDGIECCFNENDPKEPAHLHVRSDKEFISELIIKAIPEIHGEQSERHAKSFEMAQEEVLTCIGLFLYDRLFSLYQAVMIQEQAWQMLFYSCVLEFIKKFRLEIEKKNFDLDKICAELEAIGESRNQVAKSGKPAKPRPKRTKSVKSSQSVEETPPEPEPNTHTCYSGEKSSRILTVLNRKSSNASKCNANTKTNKTKKRFVTESHRCECDDESLFEHDEKPAAKCDKNCCFDIIEYWNRLVAEEERKVTPRRLKVNYVDEDEIELITDEEKREYFENRAQYLALRMEKRRQLMQNWSLLSGQQFKLIAKTNQ